MLVDVLLVPKPVRRQVLCNFEEIRPLKVDGATGVEIQQPHVGFLGHVLGRLHRAKPSRQELDQQAVMLPKQGCYFGRSFCLGFRELLPHAFHVETILRLLMRRRLRGRFLKHA